MADIDLSWTDNATDEQEYYVDRSSDGTNFTTIATLAANTTSYVDSGLPSGAERWYRVRAGNASGSSGPSNIVRVKADAGPQMAGPTITNNNVAGTSHSVNMPATVEAGMGLFIHIGFEDIALTTVNTPAGWTEIQNIKNSFMTSVYFAKVADGTEGGTTVTVTTTESVVSLASVHSWWNWRENLADIELATAYAPNNSSQQNFSPPALTPSWGYGKTLWLTAVVSGDDDETATTFPAGYTGTSTVAQGLGIDNSVSLHSCWKEEAATTETPGNYILTGSERVVANTIGIRFIEGETEPPPEVGFYIGPSGSDTTGTGTQANPWQTLTKARDEMRTSATKTTYLLNGTYNLTSSVSLTSADNGTAYRASAGASPVISGGGGGFNLFDCSSSDNVTWEGLTLTNDQTSTEVWGIDLNNCDNTAVVDCTFQSMFSGYRVRDGSTTNYVLECTFTDMHGNESASSPAGTGLRMEDNVVGVTIAGCNFSNNMKFLTNSGFGQSVVTQRNCQNVTFEYNYVTDWGASFTNFGNPPTANTKHDNFFIRYNKFENGGSHGKDAGAVYVNDRPNLDRNVTLQINDNWVQNVGWNSVSPDLIWLNGIYLDDSAGNWNVFNNVVINCRSVSVHNHGGPDNSITNNIMLVETTDPQLTGSAVSGWAYPKFYENQGDDAYSDGSPMNTTWARNIMVSVSPTTGQISSYSAGGNWWQNNSSGAPGFEEPNILDNNTKYQNLPNWTSAGETNPDNTDPGFADIANFDFTLASLPGTGFAHIPGITDGATYFWSSPADNPNSGYNRSNYI